MRLLRGFGMVLGALLLVLGAATSWLLFTQSGARWLATRADRALDTLSIQTVQGTVAGPLTIADVRYRDVESGKDIRIGRATVDVALGELLRARVRVRALDATDVDVRLMEPTKPPPEKPPMSLDPPIDIAVDRASVTNARVEQNGKVLARIVRANLAAAWTAEGVAVRRLDIDAREGRVRFEGLLDERSGRFLGRGAGRFRWALGAKTYAGTLTAKSDARAANADVRLTEPVSARLGVTLQQTASLHWRLELDVDRFDPRRRLGVEGSLESLAATLRANGDRDAAIVRGEVLVNGERVRIETLHVTLQEQRIDIRTLALRIEGRRGVVHASGNVRLDAKPFLADLSLRWQDVQLPPEWVGQPLATHGTLEIEGNPDRFGANGRLSIGPPGRLASVRLALNGTPQSIRLENLTIAQPRGRGHLNARGDVRLQPQISWTIDAEAAHFDPGLLFVAWPGDLGFDLATTGRMTEAGPSASLALRKLQGELRHRAISGEADLAVTPAKVVTGTLRVASGRSTILVEGKRGDRLDLAADLDVASLDDWVPGARGSFAARFEATGLWPAIRIDGSARGDRLAIGDTSVAILRAQLDVENPQDPSGALTVTARGADTGGFEFAELGLHAEGGLADHVVRLRARGTPLSAELNVRGGRQGAAWAGTLEQLTIAAKDVPRLALRKPVRASVEGSRFSVSETCLAGRGVSICAEAAGDMQGEMQGRYVIESLPLALVRVLAAPELPLALGGALQSRGTLRRAADGALFGEAEISSPEGRVMQLEIDEEPLLTWQNVRVTARLDGDTASAELDGALGGGGRLDAEASATGLRAAAPRLKGRADIVIGDLRSVEVFTPQLASVQGRVEARGSFEGTPGSIGIAAAAHVREFAAEIPALGLKLREGNFEASMQPAGGARFSGSISSADGQVKINGTAGPTGVIKATLRGNQVLAADIPAGRIIVDPELTFSRTPERASLEGKVLIPDAKIDLTKLPQGGKVQSSPDVVVIDEPAAEKERDDFPLHTNVTLVVGPDVELTGFGLEARVQGILTVRERPGDEPLASGEIRLEGTYKAYGQDLTIERGRLLYTGTPLNDPRLDILAVRKVQEVTAQLRITGSARSPELAVSADPAMSQTEALSYLVRGRSMNQLGGEDADLMQTAARSLGGAAGNLIAKNIGKRLGIDEIGIEQSEELGGSAFTVGQYLSPRLYLSYGFGLFEPGEVVTLRYELSDELSLRVSQGTEEQRAGIEYRIER